MSNRRRVSFHISPLGLTMTLDYHHILAAIDFSPVSRDVVRKADKLCRIDNAHLTVVSVVDEVPVYSEPFGEFAAPSIDAQYWRDLQAMTRKRLETFVAELLGNDQRTLEVLTGAPKTEIPRYASENDIELIVMGSHGHRGVFAMLGSTTDGVIHRAACDVLTVRSSS